MTTRGITIDLAKVKAMMHWARPTMPTKIRSFLGLAGYYRKFIEGFSRLALPLTKLTQKGQELVWNDACKLSFQELKKRLTLAPILIFPDLEKKFNVYCYRSGQGLVVF